MTNNSKELFKFKQFSVMQDQCAMKIGTDGVLLGGWVCKKNKEDNKNAEFIEQNILDIGTGTGVIALQMAQEFPNAQIDAIELVPQAYLQAVENFENSSWSDRLFCYHAYFQEFVNEIDDIKYDLIISNPPFFNEDTKTLDKSRNTARFEENLPLEDLLTGANHLLSEKGNLAIIIPYHREELFISFAKKHSDLQILNITRVKGNKKSSPKRSLLWFVKNTRNGIMIEQSHNPIIDELTIEIERHQYTKDYKELVKGFYLKM